MRIDDLRIENGSVDVRIAEGRWPVLDWNENRFEGLDLRMSGDVPDAVNAKVQDMLKAAAERAKENGRSTLRPYDL